MLLSHLQSSSPGCRAPSVGSRPCPSSKDSAAGGVSLGLMALWARNPKYVSKIIQIYPASKFNQQKLCEDTSWCCTNQPKTRWSPHISLLLGPSKTDAPCRFQDLPKAAPLRPPPAFWGPETDVEWGHFPNSDISGYSEIWWGYDIRDV